MSSIAERSRLLNVATTPFDIDAGLVSQLETLGRAENATAFMVSLAAFYR
jgi:hypothetical protein